jgi:hypothetical protein
MITRSTEESYEQIQQSLLKAASKIKDAFKTRTKKSPISKKKPSETQLRKRQSKKASAGMWWQNNFSLSVIKSNELSWRTGLPARTASWALTKTALSRAVHCYECTKLCTFWCGCNGVTWKYTHVTTSVTHDHELHAQAEIFIYRLVRILWSSRRYFKRPNIQVL